MLVRHLNAVNLLRRVATQNVARCMMSSDYGAEHAHKSMVQVVTEHRTRISDLPIPAGSWKEHHDKRNMKWNIFLAASIVTLIATATVVVQSGTVYLHGPPDYKKVQIDASKIRAS